MSIHPGLPKFFHELAIFQGRGNRHRVRIVSDIQTGRQQAAVQSKRSL